MILASTVPGRSGHGAALLFPLHAFLLLASCQMVNVGATLA
jgi:hypothetical protein